jgi:hypothetical protein
MDPHDRPGCLSAIRRALGVDAAPQEAEQLPYRVRDDFLSPAERNLYGVLCAAVGEWATVCPRCRSTTCSTHRAGTVVRT